MDKIDPPAKDPKRNPCPICGKPRGKGTKTEFAHGQCMEKRAATEGKELVKFKGSDRMVKKEDLERWQRNSRAKAYVSGKKLPTWMTDK